MSAQNKIQPVWYEGEIPENSYRALFKWGDPLAYKHPNRGLVRLMREVFELSAEDLARPRWLGLEPLEIDVPSRLTPEQTAALERICGSENVRLDTRSRLRASYGKGMIDELRLRLKIVENLPEAVVCPRSAQEVRELVAWCARERMPLYVFGGGSSVTRGMEAVKGGITLDLSVHLNRVLEFNETDQTITVEPGITGPALEEALNQAPERFGARRRYTCGHFPQSFEYSTVGGWVVTRGAGQNSTYYGKIEDIVLAQEMVTPAGVLRTLPHPRAATGPDFDQILMGSEGTFGVLTSVTLRIFRLMPRSRRGFSFFFKTWEQALDACRETLQCEAGLPSVFRLSDPEETDVALRMYGLHATPADSLLQALGYRPMQRCLLLGTADGAAGYTASVARAVRRIARSRGALDVSLLPIVKKWEESRFRDPYLREDLMDYGVLIDTLECGVTWSQMPEVHARVRAVVKARPRTVCMTHLSHAYPQGGNLYFIFIARIDNLREYLEMQYAIIDAICKSGAAISHHHGVGKQTAPWLEEQIGAPAMAVIRALKRHFDPDNLMNPGGTLGLDMSPEQARRRWGLE